MSFSASRLFRAAVTIVALLNIMVMVLQLVCPFPLNPWESGMVVDGYRAACGEAIYTDPVSDHATWMYGPLSIQVVASWFRISGPSNYPGRFQSLLSAGILFLLLTYTFTRGQPRSCFWIGLGLFATLHIPSCSYLTDSRPDFPAALFGYLFLAATYVAIQRNSHFMTVLGLFCLVIGMLFKQTIAVTAIVPACVILLHSRKQLRSHWWRLVLPPLVVLLTVFCICLLSPMMYHFMVRVPGTFPLVFSPEKLAVFFLLYTPLFLLVVCVRQPTFLFTPNESASPAAWAFACTLVATAAAVLFCSKRGGNYNAFLLPWMSMLAICCARLTDLFSWLDRPGRDRLWQFGLTLIAPILVLATLVVGFPGTLVTALWLRNGDGRYGDVIRHVRGLPGKVICPEDPTIPLYAGRRTGRSLVLEMDASSWSPSMPPHVRREFDEADWVVRVDSLWSGILGHLWLDEPSLRQLGYIQVDGAMPEGSVYSLWKNEEHQHELSGSDASRRDGANGS